MNRRHLVAALAALCVLVAGPAAHAADDLTNGVLLDGSEIKVAVYEQGVISGRFANSMSTFYCCTDDGVSPYSAQFLALHVNGTIYARYANPFTQVSAPALTGSGTAGDPWLVTSVFDATAAGLRVTHVVRHVNTSRAIRETFTVTNTGATAVPFALYRFNDLYVAGSDSGSGLFEVGPPRAVSGVANDGTKVSLVEMTPWSHYFEGGYGTAWSPNNQFGYTYSDSVVSSVIDNGLGVQWNVDELAAGDSASFLVQERFSITGGVLPITPVFTSTPGDGTATDASIGFEAASGDTAAAAFECSLDGAPYDVCTSPFAATALAVGGHTFGVRGLNIDGDTGPVATTTWTVHAPVPLAPVYTSTPTDSTATDASIGFEAASGDTGVDTFECSLDGASYAVCSSPVAAATLTVGPHSFSVRGVNVEAVAGPSATATWTVQAPLPVAPVYTSTPADGTATDVSIAFEAAPGDAAAVAFECSLDGAPYNVCSTPFAATGLAVGAHSLDVRALNIEGVAGPIATATWTVQTPPVTPDTTPPGAPPIVTTPAATTAARTALVTFTGEADAVFVCRLDAGAWIACTSPFAVAGLAAGQHTLEVRQTDLAGNTSIAASVAWRVKQPAKRPAAPRGPSVVTGGVTTIISNRTALSGCGLARPTVRSCRVVLQGPGGVTLGTGSVRAPGMGTHRVAAVIKLTAAGQRLANRPGGVRTRFDATILPAGAGRAMHASAVSRLVASQLLVVPADLAFEPGSATLSAAGKRYLQRLNPQLASAKRITCFGYTDSRGSEARNLALGGRRAAAVCRSLGRGLGATVRTVGVGELNPRASNAATAGRALNRRVELRIYYT